MRPSKEAGRALHVPVSEQRADARRGHRVSSVTGQGHAHHLEAVLRAQPAEQIDIAAPGVTEVEVLPDHDQSREQFVDEHLLDEVLSRLLGADFVEGHHEGPVDAALGQQLELLLQPGELLEGGLGTHHRGRVPVEGDHHGGEAGCRRPRREITEQRTVAEVHPVVRTDRDGGSCSGHRD